jgi:hypothetical protein
MNDERTKVLEMVAAGQVTVDQANQLLEALGRYDGSHAPRHPDRSGPSDSSTRSAAAAEAPQNLRISGEHTLLDLAPGDVTVEAGGYLVLLGRVAQDLILEEGARVDFRGSVGRDFYNRSGATVELYGLVEGDVYNAPGSKINLYGLIEGDAFSSAEALTVLGKLKGSLREE